MQRHQLFAALSSTLMTLACWSHPLLAAEPTAGSGQAAAPVVRGKIEPNAKNQKSTKTNQPAPSKPISLAAVSVTGYSSSLTRAMSIKQSADTIVDAISAQDVGDYPDINVAESLQRVTGVQISRLSPDGSTANEGNTVTVRGLPTEFNYITLNGDSIASASNNLITQSADRSFDFSVLSPDFISSLQVVKSPKADMTEGGIAATIDVNTIMPLDIGKEILKASASGQASTNENSPKENVSAIYSNVFANNTFGLTLGLSENKRQYINDSYTDAQLDQQTINKKNYLVLDSLGISKIYNSYDTKTAYLALQFRPRSDLDFSLVAIGDRTKNYEDQSAFNIRPQYGSSYPNLVADASNVLTTQIANGNYFEDQTFDTWNTQKQNSLQFKTQWRPGNWEVNGALAFSNSRTESEQIGIDTLEAGGLGVGPSYTGGYRIIPGDPIASFVLDPNFNVSDPNNYFMNYAGGNLLNRGDTVRSAKIDATYNFDDSFINSIEVGARIQKENITNSSIFFGSTALGHADVAPFVGSWPHGGSSLNGYTGGANVPTNFPYIDPRIFLSDYYDGSLTNFQNANPIGGVGSNSNQDPTNQYGITEYDRAAYVMANYQFNGSIPIHGNIGVRLVSTGESVTDNTYNLNDVTFDLPPPPPPAPAYTAPAYSPINFSHSYTEVLPSFNLTADLRPDLFLRFAAAETMTRPTLANLAPAYRFAISPGNYVLESGNPNLNPFKARQYDMSLEWYFAPGSMLSTAVFYKDVATFIQTESQPLAIQGYPFTQEFPVNSTGGNVKGVEANYIQMFPFLPGFLSGLGMQLNTTWAVGVEDADPVANIPRHGFENLSKWTANASVFWERNGWSLRAAYNYRSKYLADPNVRGIGVTSAWGNSYAELDFQASYAISKNFSVFLEGTNLAGKPQTFNLKTLYGNSASYPQTWISGDRRISAGVRVSL
jgi:iron complex outermembrane receptor protein